jgi:ATP-dependent DNA helicase RecQ
VAELGRRFEARERQELGRLDQVLALVTRDGCQVNALVGYFGEQRPQPCGHCTHCQTGRPQVLPPARLRQALPAALDLAALRALCREQPAALGSPRQVARFLCGLSSPALARARIGRHALFGALEAWPFGQVLAWTAEAALTG